MLDYNQNLGLWESESRLVRGQKWGLCETVFLNLCGENMGVARDKPNKPDVALLQSMYSHVLIFKLVFDF